MVAGDGGGGWWRGMVAGDGGGSTPNFFSSLPRLTFFSGLFLEMVISHDNYKVRWREFKYAIQTFPARRLRKMFQSSGTCPSVLNVT